MKSVTLMLWNFAELQYHICSCVSVLANLCVVCLLQTQKTYGLYLRRSKTQYCSWTWKSITLCDGLMHTPPRDACPPARRQAYEPFNFCRVPATCGLTVFVSDMPPTRCHCGVAQCWVGPNQSTTVHLCMLVGRSVVDNGWSLFVMSIMTDLCAA